QAMGTLKELLAKPDTLRITTPVLPRETMERVLEVLRKDVSADKVRVDNPTQNLESYFLEIVEKAKRAAAETSGAQSGAKVAAYCGAGTKKNPPTDKVLKKLTLPQVPPAPPEAVQPAGPAVDEKKLEALTKSAEPVPTQAAPAEEKSADLSKADEKLSSL